MPGVPAFVWIVAINAVALAVIYQRFGDGQGIIPLVERLGAAFSFKSIKAPRGLVTACGLYPHATYTVHSTRVVLPDGVRPAYILVSHGTILEVQGEAPGPGHGPLLDFKDAVISPGVIDVHTHLNEPGREAWEGVSTGTAAAARGGVTTVVDMPLNSAPSTTTPELLRDKVAVGKAKARVHIAYWGGLTPANAHDPAVLDAMLAGGAIGFKSFMCPSGINDFANVSRADVAAAVAFCKAHGVPYMVHAELVSDVPPTGGSPRSFATYLATRPAAFERAAIQMLVEVLDADESPAMPGFILHVAHLADAESLDVLANARTRHPLSVETCAHYLNFAAEDIADGDTLLKCSPPLRDGANRAALRAAAAAGPALGGLEIVSSDHSPAPPDLKERESGNFLKAWGGISGLQYLLPATWTSLRSEAGFDLVRLSHLLSTAPALLTGLQSKGAIANGFDADFVVWDPEAPADTSAASNLHKHPISPYAAVALVGRVQATIVSGHVIVLHGAAAKTPCGGVVLRGQ